MSNLPNMCGFQTDEPGIGSWSLRERTAEASRLEVAFTYSDKSTTTTTEFLTRDAIPGKVRTEAGVFSFSGDETGGDVTFSPEPSYIAALRALRQRIYFREMLVCGVFQVPLDYIVDVLGRWPTGEIKSFVGMFMLGITRHEIAALIADNPAATPVDIMIAARMQQ